MKDLSLHVLDIVQNSIKAKSDRIDIFIEVKNKNLTIEILDNGFGMKKEFVDRIFDPYSTTRTTRKVGLGLPMFLQTAEATGGYVEIESKLGQGTNIKALLKTNSIDRQPLGDMADTMKILILSAPETRYILNLQSENGKYIFDTDEIRANIGDLPIVNYDVLQWIYEYLNENIVKIFGGILDEINS